MEGNDNRRHARIDVKLPGTLLLDSDRGLTSVAAEIRDLSPHGICIHGSCPTKRFTQGHVEFALPDGEITTMNLAAELVWVDGDGFGLRFTRLAHQDRLRLANFVLQSASHESSDRHLTPKS